MLDTQGTLTVNSIDIILTRAEFIVGKLKKQTLLPSFFAGLHDKVDSAKTNLGVTHDMDLRHQQGLLPDHPSDLNR